MANLCCFRLSLALTVLKALTVLNTGKGSCKMAKMCAPLMLYIATAMFRLPKGLEVTPSTEPTHEKFYYAGSNLTLSCSEKDLIHMDWMKNSSVVSSCSIDQMPYCLPGGRYNYENGSFNFMLTNMTSKDCTEYTCRTFTGSKSFSLHLIDPVKDIDVEENTNSITMTTNCVYPANTVNVQWFYIHEDAAPALYNKPAKRSEERENCVETCWENKALKVLSTLELPADVNNPIKVKMMMYVEHGGLITKRFSDNLYTIEGCLPPMKDGIIFALCLAVILIIVDVICICRLKRHQHEQGKDEEAPISLEGTEPTNRVGVQGAEEQMQEEHHAKKQTPDDVIVPIVVSGVIFTCCILLLVLKHETRIPDINGNCQDVYITNMTVVVAVTFVIILICIHWKVLRKIVILIRGILGKMMVGKTDEGHPAESKGFLQDVDITQCVDGAKTGSSTNVDIGRPESAEETHAGSIQVTNEQNEEDIRVENKEAEFAVPLRQEKNTCSKTLPCFPSRTNTVLTSIGESGKLTCSWDTDKKPSWQDPSGKIINYGGKNIKTRFINKISWGQDEKSIIVSDVQLSDAGTYLCFLANGNVQSIDLVAMLPTEIIVTSVNKTVHLDPGKDITRVRPVWRRATPIVAELYSKVPDDRIELGSDGKSICIKQCNVEDSGLYEVMGNNVIKRFDLSITNNEQIDNIYTVHEGDIIRLDSSSKVSYPSWECVGADIFNYGGEEQLRSISSGILTEKASRFSWSVDKKSLMIKGILPNDTGTYVCRHLNGFVESVTVIVRGKPQPTITVRRWLQMEKMEIPHYTGYKFPSLQYATNTDESEREVIARQNFESPEFAPTKNHQNASAVGYIYKYKKEKAVECSVYGRSIQVFEVNESDNRESD